jgi:hypothetical protein
VHYRLPVVAHGEVRLPELAVRPDFAIEVDGAPIGYLELKAPGKGVPGSRSWRPTPHDRRQWEKLSLLPNILYTDGATWGHYHWGEPVGAPATVTGDLDRAGSRLRPSDTRLADVFEGFLDWQPAQPPSLGQLIRRSARLCRLLRDEVLDALAMERRGKSRRLLSGHLDDWRSLLFPQLTDDRFADGYGQTVVFGLLLARRAGVPFEGLDLPEIGRKLAKKHALVGRALAILTDDNDSGESITERSVALPMLLRVIGASDWTTWRTDATDQLYENFLEKYDPALRRSSGSYFTPRPVADFMVRFVDDLLRTELDRDLGLANQDVVSVDPAMGTGTFLLSALNHAVGNIARDGGDIPAELASLLHRLVGFERQIAPYAIAELKLHQALVAHGTEVGDEKVRFYLTDTLDVAIQVGDTPGMSGC